MKNTYESELIHIEKQYSQLQGTSNDLLC